MFNNIGRKIKGVAQFVTWLGIIASVIFSIILIVTEDSIGLAIAVLITGCVGSWLSSLTLYGFGQLIENSDIIAGRLNHNGLEGTTLNEPQDNPSLSDNVEKDSATFDQIVNQSNLSTEQKAKIKELKEWKDEELISANDCRRRIKEVISDQPSNIVLQIINKV